MTLRPRWLLPVVTLIATAGLGWYLGSAAYRAVLRARFGQVLSRGDATAVRVSIVVASALTAPLILPVVVAGLNKRITRDEVRAVAGFVIGAFGGLIPAMLIALFWSGGRMEALLHPELPLLLVWTGVLIGSMAGGMSLHSRFWTRFWQ